MHGIMDKAIERKQEHGPGYPQETEQEDNDEEIDIVINKFEELLSFSNGEDSDVDE